MPDAKCVIYVKNAKNAIFDAYAIRYLSPRNMAIWVSKDASGSKSLSIVFSPVDLAIIYNSEEVLENVFEHMDDDPDYFEYIANLKLGTNMT